MNSCCGSLIKYLVFITNLIIFLLGCLVLGFGIYALVNNGQNDILIFDVDSSLYQNIHSNTAEIILVIVSGIIILVSFLGCCGAVLENRGVIFVYFTIMLITTVITTIGSTLVFTKTIDDVTQPLLSSLQRYNPNSTDVGPIQMTQVWDQVQSENSCCGVNDYRDWHDHSSIFPQKPGALDHQIPASCCSGLDSPEASLECQTRPYDQKFAKRLDGCFSALTMSFQGREGIVGYFAIAVIGIMIINLVVLFSFALCLAPRTGYAQV